MACGGRRNENDYSGAKFDCLKLDQKAHQMNDLDHQGKLCINGSASVHPFSLSELQASLRRASFSFGDYDSSPHEFPTEHRNVEIKKFEHMNESSPEETLPMLYHPEQAVGVNTVAVVQPRIIASTSPSASMTEESQQTKTDLREHAIDKIRDSGCADMDNWTSFDNSSIDDSSPVDQDITSSMDAMKTPTQNTAGSAHINRNVSATISNQTSASGEALRHIAERSKDRDSGVDMVDWSTSREETGMESTGGTSSSPARNSSSINLTIHGTVTGNITLTGFRN